MHRFLEELKDFNKKADWVLLTLCLVTSGVGLVVMASATSAEKFGGNTKYLIIQLAAIALGVLMFAIVSSIDAETISENRMLLTAFNIFLLLLLIPFGTDNNTGNRSWLKFPGIPISIQPAEICKITYILIMASKIPSVMHMVVHLGILVGLNMVLSGDAGVSLIFVFIFIGMAFAGGVNLVWFAVAIAAIGVMVPVVWPLIGEYQRQRIQVLIDPNFDKQGLGARYHSKINLMSLTGGGLTGQGLFHGNRTQGGMLFAQHTDYIFSSVGGYAQPGIYAAAYLLRRCLCTDVPADDQCRHVHRRYARYRPDPAADFLRRLLHRHHLRHAWPGLRRLRTTPAAEPRAIYPAVPIIRIGKALTYEGTVRI